jgi:hypothetical protein
LLTFCVAVFVPSHHSHFFPLGQLQNDIQLFPWGKL